MRTVRLELSAEQDYEQCKKQHPRFEEIYQGMEWLLSKDPGTQGMSLARDGMRLCVNQSGWGSMPTIAIVYTHSDEMVTIYGILLKQSGLSGNSAQ